MLKMRLERVDHFEVLTAARENDDSSIIEPIDLESA
jgi:hypothetical protein